MQTRTDSLSGTAAVEAVLSPPAGLLTEARGDHRPTPLWFDAARVPFGDRSLDLKFGPVRFRIDGLAPNQAADLAGRFRPFLDAGTGAQRVTVRLELAEIDHFLREPAAGTVENYRLEHRRDEKGLAIWSYEFAGRLDLATGRARLALVEGEGARFDRGLENFLRVLTASYILDGGGFLLHGAGVVRDGEAHIFFGPSGSGKTTVTDLSPHDVVLSDDLTLIVRTDRGYEAAGIPFGMAHHRVPGTTGSFPVAGFYKLVQAPQVRREPVPYSLAVAEVAACLPFVMQEGAQVVIALDNLARALTQIPVYRLEFRKDPSFWGAITRGH